jgi:hypothetical protein
MSDNTPLTVVLVHGAFADASSWNVILTAAAAVDRTPAGMRS